MGGSGPSTRLGGAYFKAETRRWRARKTDADDLHFVSMMDRALAEAWKWDEPELDEIILPAVASSCRRAEEGD